MPDDARKVADLETELAETYRSITELTNEVSQANELLKNNNHKLSELYDTAHQFVDNVSHEFRTPLTVIKEFASIQLDSLAGEINDEQREHLNIIVDCVDDLAVMVDDMLDISKLEAGLLGVARRKCRIEKIVEHIRTVLERKAAASRVSFEMTIEDSLPAVYCDAEKIGRVVINLATNAFKFSSEGGEVSLWARHDQDQPQIIVGVTDNGPGIAPEDLQVLFERFRQVGGNVRASTKGFGLGLNIAKELVQLNFGDIEVESEPGSGSTFTFTVPVFDPPKILEQFMKRIEHFRNGSSYVSLIAARTDPRADSALRDDVEQFLQRQLRRSDLVFRAQPGAWLVCAATNKRQLDKMIARFEEAHAGANRNRIGADLPAIEFDVQGTWRVHDEGAQFITHFKSSYEIPNACHA